MNKQELERITNLPDVMSSEELEKEFQKLHTQTQPISQEQNIWLLKAYFELSDRQWHTYKPLPLHLLNKVDSVLINLWDSDSVESTELLLSIVGCLGLIKTFETIKSALDIELPAIVKQEILEAVKEFGNTVADPYSGLHEGSL